jgi:hypothetical protein
MSSLKYFEMPSTVTSIEGYGFNGCPLLFKGAAQSYIDNWFSHITNIGGRAFINCDSFPDTVNFPGCLTVIGTRAFASLGTLSNITFGGEGDESLLDAGQCGEEIFDGVTFDKITIYTKKDESYLNKLINCFLYASCNSFSRADP